jgi:hypothetical protein
MISTLKAPPSCLRDVKCRLAQVPLHATHYNYNVVVMGGDVKIYTFCKLSME